MMPGMNPRQMQDMMRKMGMQQTAIDAEQVIIRTKDKDIIIENPEVSKVTVMGQQTYQVAGQAREEKRVLAAYEPTKEDIDTVAEQASVPKDKAKAALVETKGDIAEAILKLSE